MRWYFDGELYKTGTPADIEDDGPWVFDDHPFELILNLSVGGYWPGKPDETTPFPASLVVDYIRIYQRDDLAAAGKKLIADSSKKK